MTLPAAGQESSNARELAARADHGAPEPGAPSRDATDGHASTTGAAALRVAGLLLLLGAAMVLAVRLGAVSLSLREVVDGVLGRGDPTTVTIVRQLRLPRAVQAALVGAALAVSGTTFQALVRNPLAEPYLLGVSSGAAVGTVAAVVLGLATAAAWVIPVAAFAGALVAIALVFRIAYGVGRVLDTRVLLLSGVVVAAFFNALILLLLTFSDIESFRSAVFWMMGSHAGATWGNVLVLLGYVAPAAIVLAALARPLDLLALGEQTAAYLGTHVERTKLVAYALASLLAAAAVAVSGVIGFVGLVVPHIARMLWGSSHRTLLPNAALLGASFLVLADLLARLVARPVELPIGVVTAFLGVPFFVWLLRQRGGGAR